MNEQGIRQLGVWLSKFILLRHQNGSDKMLKNVNYYYKDFQIFLLCNWMGKKTQPTNKQTNKQKTNYELPVEWNPRFFKLAVQGI